MLGSQTNKLDGEIIFTNFFPIYSAGDSLKSSIFALYDNPKTAIFGFFYFQFQILL